MQHILKFLAITAMLLLLSNAAVNASAPDTLWTRMYGGTGQDVANSVCVGADGFYGITGGTTSFGHGYYDVYLVRVSQSGDEKWAKAYGGTGFDVGYCILESVLGGYIIAGTTDSFGAGEDDVYLVKTDAIGDTVWTRAYGGTLDDRALSIREVECELLIIAGYTTQAATGRDVYMLLVGEDGDTSWVQSHGGTGEDQGHDALLGTDVNYYVVGFTDSYGAGSDDVYLIKTDTGGDTLWTRTYGGTEGDRAYSFQEVPGGGFIITGATYSFGAGGSDVYLIRTDAAGDTLWHRAYGGPNSDVGYEVQVTYDGLVPDGFVVAGYTYSYGAGEADFYFIKTDLNGDSLWTTTYGRTYSDRGSSVKVTTDGGFILAGNTDESGTNIFDAYVIKTQGEEASVDWRHEITGFRISEVTPNPSRGAITVVFEIPQREHVEAALYDVTGRLVAHIQRGYLEGGQHSLTWDGTDHAGREVPSGIYFCEVKTGDDSARRKAVIMR